jgi:hypothetical protein
VQTEARICRFCGFRFEGLKNAEPAQRLSRSQIAALALYALLAGPPLASVSSQDTPITRLLSGALIGLLIAAIVGTINWAAFGRRHGRTWLRATVSPGPLLISLVLVVVDAAGQPSGS